MGQIIKLLLIAVNKMVYCQLDKIVCAYLDYLAISALVPALAQVPSLVYNSLMYADIVR